MVSWWWSAANSGRFRELRHEVCEAVRTTLSKIMVAYWAVHFTIGKINFQAISYKQCNSDTFSKSLQYLLPSCAAIYIIYQPTAATTSDQLQYVFFGWTIRFVTRCCGSLVVLQFCKNISVLFEFIQWNNVNIWSWEGLNNSFFSDLHLWTPQHGRVHLVLWLWATFVKWMEEEST